MDYQYILGSISLTIRLSNSWLWQQRGKYNASLVRQIIQQLQLEIL